MTRQVLLVLLGLLFCYGLIEAWPLLRGPVLSIESPLEGATSTDGSFLIQGTVAHTLVFTLNGAPLLYDQKGAFSSTLTYPRGGTILTFVAADRFGRTVRETRTIFVP